MNLFQILFAPLAVLLFLRSFVRFLRGAHPRGTALAGVFIWLAAALTILRPDLTVRAAKFLGIGRGTDLVLYVLTLCFLVSVFYFYSRLLQLESNLSEIVRKLALADAPRTPAGTQAGQTEAAKPPLPRMQRGAPEATAPREAPHRRGNRPRNQFVGAAAKSRTKISPSS